MRLPEPFRARKLTNPDAPGIDVRIELVVDGESLHAVPILYSRVERYDVAKGGEFFRYLVFRLMVVERASAGWPRYCSGDI